MRVRRLEHRNRELESRIAERTAEVVEQRNELARVNGELGRANDDMGAVLDRLRAAVLMLGTDGRVTFLNRAALAFLEADADNDIGRPWTELLPVADEDRARIAASWASPAARRTRVPVRLIRSAAASFWMEVETQDDPRDPARHILFLYDVSDLSTIFRRLLDDRAQFHGLVGESRALQLVFRQIRDVAAVEATVLIEGETGTGKELVARAIHYHEPARSSGRSSPSTAPPCTESLLESELFGHARGAFTGAVADKRGRLRGGRRRHPLPRRDRRHVAASAAGAAAARAAGTARSPASATRSRRTSTSRILAATHRDLERAVRAGSSARTCSTASQVIVIRVPPLRERREDIPLLVVAGSSAGFAAPAREPVATSAATRSPRSSATTGPATSASSRARSKAPSSPAPPSVIQTSDLPGEVTAAAGAALSPDERQRILEALARTEGNRAAAARLLGIGRTTLYRRLKELDIAVEES